MPRILVVDDDPETCRLMNELLREPEREIEMAESPEQALAQLAGGRFDLVVSDINLNADQNGLDLLRAFKASDPEVEVVLISAFGTLETALEAVKAGAFDYVSKPVDIAQVREVVSRALARRARRGAARGPLPRRARGSRRPLRQERRDAGGLQADRDRLPRRRAGARDAARPAPARSWWRARSTATARARARPFVRVNCGALPEALLESELFGHVRGAFTGAVARPARALRGRRTAARCSSTRSARCRRRCRCKLLRVLEERRGASASAATRDRRSTCASIAATHRDLERAVREGSFREDLFYRLNVVVDPGAAAARAARGHPAARRRTSWRLAARRARRRGAHAAAVAALAAHDWPGNVRELENTLERLVAEARGGTIDVPDLPPVFRERPAALEEPLFSGLPSLEELEKRYLRHVLAEMRGNRSRAAEVLGIDRRTLYRMAERFGIELGDDATPPRE